MARDLAGATEEYRSAQAAVEDAKAQVKTKQQELRAAREGLRAAVVAAYLNGTRMRDLAEMTGLSREWLRQWLRAAGVDPE